MGRLDAYGLELLKQKPLHFGKVPVAITVTTYRDNHLQRSKDYFGGVGGSSRPARRGEGLQCTAAEGDEWRAETLVLGCKFERLLSKVPWPHYPGKHCVPCYTGKPRATHSITLECTGHLVTLNGFVKYTEVAMETCSQYSSQEVRKRMGG